MTELQKPSIDMRWSTVNGPVVFVCPATLSRSDLDDLKGVLKIQLRLLDRRVHHREESFKELLHGLMQ